MNLELKPEEITFTAVRDQVAEYMLITKTVPEFINMTLEQYQRFNYLVMGAGSGFRTFRGIPLQVQGVPVA